MEQIAGKKETGKDPKYDIKDSFEYIKRTYLLKPLGRGWITGWPLIEHPDPSPWPFSIEHTREFRSDGIHNIPFVRDHPDSLKVDEHFSKDSNPFSLEQLSDKKDRYKSDYKGPYRGNYKMDPKESAVKPVYSQVSEEQKAKSVYSISSIVDKLAKKFTEYAKKEYEVEFANDNDREKESLYEKFVKILSKIYETLLKPKDYIIPLGYDNIVSSIIYGNNLTYGLISLGDYSKRIGYSAEPAANDNYIERIFEGAEQSQLDGLELIANREFKKAA